eukprot:3363266-Amphidinium_carterae.1
MLDHFLSSAVRILLENEAESHARAVSSRTKSHNQTITLGTGFHIQMGGTVHEIPVTAVHIITTTTIIGVTTAINGGSPTVTCSCSTLDPQA